MKRIWTAAVLLQLLQLIFGVDVEASAPPHGLRVQRLDHLVRLQPLLGEEEEEEDRPITASPTHPGVQLTCVIIAK